jgi:hypothetical protein
MRVEELGFRVTAAYDRLPVKRRDKGRYTCQSNETEE